MHPSRSAGVVGTARRKGEAGNGGDPSGAGVAASTLLLAAAQVGVGQGHSTVEAGQCRWREGPWLLVCSEKKARVGELGQACKHHMRPGAFRTSCIAVLRRDGDMDDAHIDNPPYACNETSRKAGCGKSARPV